MEPIQFAPKQKMAGTATGSGPATPAGQPATPSAATPPTPPERAVPIKLPIPMRLVWPLPEPTVNLELLPLATGVAPNYIELGKMLINNDLQYRVEPVAPAAERISPVKLFARQPYFVIPLLDDKDGKAVLVRQQNRLDQSQQFVAYHDPVARKAWVDQAQSTEPFTHIHVIGMEREWDLNGTSGSLPIVIGNPDIIGIVEALLTPSNSDSDSDTAAHPAD